MTLHVAIPTHDTRIETACMFGVLDTWSRVPCRVNVVRGSFLPRNRDMICADFLADPDARHLLCVDSDMAWTWEDARSLLALDVDFAFGFYVAKSSPPMLMCRGHLGTVTLHGRPEGHDRAEEYERCGAGFVLLTRDCVQRMTDAYARDRSYMYQGRALVSLWGTDGLSELDGCTVAEGEDFAFCRRWRAIGGRIYGHPGVRLGHVGSYTWRVPEVVA